MGGEETEVFGRDVDVLLEAANFEPIGILRSSERLALRTEGSNRWEKGVDPHLAGPAADARDAVARRARRRALDRGDRRAGRAARAGRDPLRPERADAVIGLEIAAEEQSAHPRAARLRASATTGYRVPTWRARDVTREIDLVEEVARFRLDDVPFTLPARRELFGRLTREQRLRRLVEDVLVGAGFAEAYTPSLRRR